MFFYWLLGLLDFYAWVFEDLSGKFILRKEPASIASWFL